jgi:2-polyprenyl-3-methyl-5-hydroxy-6-metoxy-1,4-benzoquinol methylase
VDRKAWLKETRRVCEEKYNAYAPLYWDTYGLYCNTTHLQFIREFLAMFPPNSRILDAACGAGRYLPFLMEKGHTVMAVDQSQRMLERLHEKFPLVKYEQIGLQEIAFREDFDGIICMDAMENVPPEDWPLVLGNFHRALRPGGLLYFTAETAENLEDVDLQQAFEKAQAAGLPVVYGENPGEDVYHYHPTNGQVREAARQAGFKVLKDADGEIWYYHLLAHKI